MINWTLQDMPRLEGRRAIVTGAAGGLGYETSLELARAGAEVFVAGRHLENGEKAVERIRRAVPSAQVQFALLDLASLESIHQFATRFEGPLDLLVNNAGVMALPTRRLTADGFEAQLGTNHLGHFALTLRLMPCLRSAAAPRVVNVSSIAHRGGRIHFEDLQFENSYRPWPAYQQSKLANLLFTFELQRRVIERGWSLVVNAAHPGYARTDLIAKGPGKMQMAWLARFFSHSAAAGAVPSLYAAVQGRPMGYYGPRGFYELKGPVAQAVVARHAWDEAAARRLWEASERLVGLSF